MDSDDLTISDLVPVGSEMLLYATPDGTYQMWAINHGHPRGCEIVHRRDDRRLIEQNKKIANEFSRTSRKADGMMHAARVPAHIVAQWDREGWSDQDKARWLNDPDNAYYRVVDSGWRF